jgi:hypothetical protein
MQKKSVLPFGGHFLQAFHNAGEKGTVENGSVMGRDDPTDVGMFLAQAPRVGLGFVMQVLDGHQDLLTAILTDPFFIVENPRNGSNRHPGHFRDVFNGCHNNSLLVLFGRTSLSNWARLKTDAVINLTEFYSEFIAYYQGKPSQEIRMFKNSFRAVNYL